MLKETITILKAIADINRLRIVKILEVKPLCVCEITDILGLATSTVSSHLSILKDAGIISDSKDGKWVNYTLNIHSKNPILSSLLQLLLKELENDDQIDHDKKLVYKVDRLMICTKQSNVNN
jgi:ArsR family transcriptional regulator